MAAFSKLTFQQANWIKPANPTQLRHVLEVNHDDVFQYTNSKPNRFQRFQWDTFVKYPSETCR